MNFIWWKHGIVYHIYPRSFYDNNNDGIGDIQGIICKLDYLSELGVNSIWLSPVYLSPQADFGYDVSDYYSIDPIFGTMDDFDSLLLECHKRDIKVIMDLIMNHTSNKHPWFIESASSINNPKRDWYIWGKTGEKKRVNNWMSAFGGSVWEYSKETDSCYLHSFMREQPDLNWRNNEMANAYFEMIEFWLEKGVDGFRLDVINMIAKDKEFRNNPVMYRLPFLQRNKFNRNRPFAFKIVQRLRNLLDKYENRMCVGEIYVLPPGNSKAVSKFIQSDKRRLHMAFDFSLFFKRFNARNYFNYIKKWNKMLEEVDWACHVFSNHDLGRYFNRNPFRLNKTEKAKITAFFQLTVPGTPFIYYGDEIGMKNVRIGRHRIKDKLGKKFWPFYSGRDQYRTPMQWDKTVNAGFSKVTPWIPLDKKFKNNCVENQLQHPDSMIALYKKLIKLRKDFVSIQYGKWVPYKKGKKGVLAYFRRTKTETILIALNFNKSDCSIVLPEGNKFKILISTNGSIEGQEIIENYTLTPFQAIACLCIP